MYPTDEAMFLKYMDDSDSWLVMTNLILNLLGLVVLQFTMDIVDWFYLLNISC
jgi:hypothetical protein